MNRESIQKVLEWEFVGNSVQSYAAAAIVFFGVWIALWVAKRVVGGRLRRLVRRMPAGVTDLVEGLLRRIDPFAYFLVALYFAAQSLVLSASFAYLLRMAFVVVLTVKVIQVVQDAALFLLTRWATRAEAEDPSTAVFVRNMTLIVRLTLWAAGLIFVLNNLNIEVTSLLATLGIGGVAVALAAQTVFADAFSSFAIFSDKPFKVGDFIIVDDMLGTVEHIGLKTTRIRSLSGEQLVFCNSDLTKSRIRNYKRMDTRRIAFKFGVVYQTAVEKVKAIPGIVEEIIRGHELARFDRAHFHSFGDFALIFEVVYHVLTPDYNRYMDVQQEFNVRIMEAFQQRGIEFAYPTQQLYVAVTERTARPAVTT